MAGCVRGGKRGLPQLVHVGGGGLGLIRAEIFRQNVNFKLGHKNRGVAVFLRAFVSDFRFFIPNAFLGNQ